MSPVDYLFVSVTMTLFFSFSYTGRYRLQGHYVRALGPIGDVNTETDVVLLEHDVPYEPFSKAVLECVDKDWEY